MAMFRGRTGSILQNLARLSRNEAALFSTSELSPRCFCPGVSGRLSPVSLSPRRVALVSKHQNRSGTTREASSLTRSTEVEEVDDEYKECFVPLTRRSLIRHIITQKDYLTDEEKSKFQAFALALDSAIINRYHGQLRELTALFDPINPDKETLTTRRLHKKELLDNEFWLLQKLAGVMACANFHELPKHYVQHALREHDARHGVKVSVNPDKYDVMRFWALGKETPSNTVSLSDRLLNLALRRPEPKPVKYFKRVVVAVRLKKDDKLLLKAFKQVPVNALEQLLPDGHIRMSRLDKGLVTATGTIALTSILAKVVTILAHVHIDWMLIVTAVMGAAGVQAWTSYKNRHLRYVNDLARMLYFKNIANNRGLLTLLVDRAEDELFKEALLMYTTLLTTRPPSALTRGSSEHLPMELGAISAQILELKVEDWVKQRTGKNVQFKSSEAGHLLTELGLLSKDLEENLHVLPLEAATRNLPLTPQSIVARSEEHDVIEGYDRDASTETDDEYKKEERKRRFFGWF